MYRILTFFSILIGIILQGFSQTCDTIFNPSPKSTLIIKASQLSNIGPGANLCLKNGKYFNIRLEGLRGNENNPINIRPYGGEVIIDTASPYGIKIGNCQNLKIDGLLDGERKIKILKTKGVGISIDDRSTDVEIAWVEIANTGLSGIVAKSDPDCSFNSTRDSFLMKNIVIRDNFLHDIGLEGMYIGSSYFAGRTIQCGGKDTTVLPHVNENVQIFNNFVYKTGYDGIQVSSTVKNCFIHDNTIWYDSQLKQPGQMSGIIIGAGNALECYNNTIIHGAGNGIEIHGQGGRVFNNVIICNGRYYRPNTQGPYARQGIFVGYNLYNPENLPYLFYNNTIYRPKSEGIKFSNTHSGLNEFINNAIIDPGIWNYYDSLNIPVERAYLNIDPGIQFVVKTNFFTRDTSAPGFVNTGEHNLMPLADSPLVDAGTNLQNQGIQFDRNYASRPLGKTFDIGAYEYFPQQGIDKENVTDSQFLVLYESKTRQIFIQVKSGVFIANKIEIFDAVGRLVFEKNIGAQNTLYLLPARKLPDGQLFYRLKGNFGVHKGRVGMIR
ncbi:MAG: right-handed parallel beta-helix repeat-containing protein [Bacteroidales bacterium]|nr:right-handed parallel beta-helix repeat-containing protein [Bacteroidales bacterium]